MILIFLGMPGSGKGTQAQLLAEKYGFEQLSTGDLVRHEIASASELGHSIQSIVEAGEYAPDEIILELVQKNLLQNKKYILDGFPRTINQATMLDKILNENNQSVNMVVMFKIQEEEVIKRLAGRFTCKKCNYITNLDSLKSSIEVCVKCGSSELVNRADDQEDKVIRRLEVYKEQTAPLENYYSTKGILNYIDASQPSNVVLEQLKILLPNKDFGSE